MINNIENLTPHAVTILAGCKAFGVDKIVLESVGVARVESQNVVGLPCRKPGKFYIVSRMVKNAVPDRDDCLVPDDIVRDEKGNIIGCRTFSL